MEAVADTNYTQNIQEPINAQCGILGGKNAQTAPKPGPGEGCPEGHILRGKNCRKVTSL